MENNKKELNKVELFEKTGVVVPRGSIDNKIFDIKVDNWDVLQLIKNKIKDIQIDINIKWFQMAKYVYIIWRDKAWEIDGCDSWSQWVAENYEYLGRGLRQIERLIRVWKVLVVDLKQPIENVASMSSTNAYEISRYAKKSNVKDLIDMGTGLETRALKKTLSQIDLEDVSKSQVFHCNHDDVVVLYKCKNCKEMFYRLPENAKIIVDKAGLINRDKAQKTIKGIKIVDDYSS